ncbi:MAG TPA: NAD(P)/FAD-dependent oxidoreductase [Longimicrobiales bacterium]
MTQRAVVVIGAGVVGLACGAELARRGHSVLILERARKHGTGISSRNSEVIHAGIYYQPGSLKARLCVTGKILLYEYMAAHDLPHARCGKLIVATTAEECAQLGALQQRAAQNGVLDLELIDAHRVAELEPAVRARAALLSPSTGILSAHGVLNALAAEVHELGGDIALRSELVGAQRQGNGTWSLHAKDERGATDSVAADVVINAAGLYADRVAALAMDISDDPSLTLRWVKGSYFNVRHLAVQRLVYPVPLAHAKTLGTHVTMDLAGAARLGPDREDLAEKREDYDVPDARGQSFLDAARSFLPNLSRDDLSPGYAGIRPQRTGAGFTDWYIAEESARGAASWINLIGMESPALTACLAIGAHVADMVAAV